MENKNVGWLLIGLSVLIIIMIFLFNSALKNIVESNCTVAHGDAKFCPMYQTINGQTYVALGVVGLLIIVGFILVFNKPDEKIIIKKIRDKKEIKHINLSSFTKDEKKIYNLIKENGAIFQADLIEKTGLGKAKMSRIIDRLEGNGLVERKRRGMTNVVVLKEN